MSDSVFNILDFLDRQAELGYTNAQRESRFEPFEHGYARGSSFQPDSYVGHAASQHYPQHRWHRQDDSIPLQSSLPLDSFDQAVLRHPAEERQREAAEGRARLSLAPRSIMVDCDPPQAAELLLDHNSMARRAPRAGPSKLQLTQYTRTPSQMQRPSSSPREQPSSPSFGASQRQKSKRGTSSRMRHQENGKRQHQPPVPVTPAPKYASAQFDAASKALALPHAPPTIQGIDLVPSFRLPDRFRSVFPMPLFNAVQSKCFHTIYETNDNFVLSSPTGSGKTCILELAVCRLINVSKSGNYKIVYQAPTKSLCSERFRDWQTKFGPLDLQCAELTGDTDQGQLRNVQNASIIITTPEKWDSMTRKWKDHDKLMRLVKLFLIDEVHLLKEDRGATLEAVVSRMKSVGSDVRFVALSATVPNSEDIATWLGKDPVNQDIPATRETFGEEFRPVKLQKHVLGYNCNGNEFMVDKVLDNKLPEVIAKYSERKPIMVFCSTRASTIATAKILANWWNGMAPQQRYWSGPTRSIAVMDEDLRYCIASGVALHHAGLDQRDRLTVEDGYLAGQINVICCTSTLAVGVNLPCHFVIIKNTANFQGKEYADLEIMQMLGRAGRPQFGDSAVAVILTKAEKVKHYEKMMSGQEILESRLHVNLIEHLNAEIGLGTVGDVATAKRWLASTFLYVRLKRNPDHYRLEGDVGGRNLEERLERICSRDLQLLQRHHLVRAHESNLRSTELGDAMARYYVQFESMKHFLGLPRKSRTSAILSALAQAGEFRDIRFRSGEKPIYKEINTSDANPVKYRIPVDLALPAHKVSLIIQATLGGIDFPNPGGKDKFSKHKVQYSTDQNLVFSHANRLIRCITDIQLHLEDSTTALHALGLGRSLSARVWDDSPLQMKQLEDVGIVTVRKLVSAGIRSIEDLENTEPHRIDTAVSRRPGYGFNLLNKLKSFPKLRVSLKMIGQPEIVRTGDCVRVQVKAEVGFLNDKVPVVFNKKPVYICLLAETSGGRKVYFCRISAKKMQNDGNVLFFAELTSKDEDINCYVMCDEIAGTQRQAMLKPNIPASSFLHLKPQPVATPVLAPTRDMHAKPTMNTSRRRVTSARSDLDSFDEGINDEDLMQAAVDDGFADIDRIGETIQSEGRTTGATQNKGKQAGLGGVSAQESTWVPLKLANGKWACNHQCKDKGDCKHLCCREGCDKPPKAPPKAKHPNATQSPTGNKPLHTGTSQRKLNLQPVSSRNFLLTPQSSRLEHLDLSKPQGAEAYAATESRDYKSLHRIHSKLENARPVRNNSANKPDHSYAVGARVRHPYQPTDSNTALTSSDFDDMDSAWWEDLPSPSRLHGEDDGIEGEVEDGMGGTQYREGVTDVENDISRMSDKDEETFEDDEGVEMVDVVRTDTWDPHEPETNNSIDDRPHSENQDDNMIIDNDEDDGIIAPWSDPPNGIENEISLPSPREAVLEPYPAANEKSLFLGSTSSPEMLSSPAKTDITAMPSKNTIKRPLTSSSDGNSKHLYPSHKRHKVHLPQTNQENIQETTDTVTAHLAGEEMSAEEARQREAALKIKQDKGYDDIDVELIMGLQGFVEFV